MARKSQVASLFSRSFSKVLNSDECYVEMEECKQGWWMKSHKNITEGLVQLHSYTANSQAFGVLNFTYNIIPQQLFGGV